MVTCKIIICENHNGLCLAMEPDNRDGSKLELGIAKLLDDSIREAFNHINSKMKEINPVLHEGEISQQTKKMLNEKWPEINR